MHMVDKNMFARLRKELAAQDAMREEVIKDSRGILKSAKQAIYAVHRGDTTKAERLLKSAATQLARLSKKKGSESIGALGDAQEEYVEARLYLAFAQDKPLPTPQTLRVGAERYLAGVCDLVGELVRAGINASIKEDYASAKHIKDFVARIYEELLQFDFRNSSLRRKFDATKYGLDKLEDLVYDLKLRGKLS
ncbi:hypothetical protein GF342_05970 [Candidatus Woesearchaeota archaeon]|nr:hypothetical protein [Candidatus Woesearchaeota archaeon]